MWNLKNDTNELIYKTRRLTDVENKLVVTKGERQERDKLGVWDSQIQPLCIKQTNNKDLLYNTGNYIKYLVLTYNGKE